MIGGQQGIQLGVGGEMFRRLSNSFLTIQGSCHVLLDGDAIILD
jgi:hypothetical protein